MIWLVAEDCRGQSCSGYRDKKAGISLTEEEQKQVSHWDFYSGSVSQSFVPYSVGNAARPEETVEPEGRCRSMVAEVSEFI